MPFLVISTLVQVLLIIHVVRSGRDRIWIWVLIMLPMAGGLAYLAMELIPEWTQTMGGRRTIRQVKDTLDPGAAARQYGAAWEQSPNAENARQFAGALVAGKRYQEALEVLARATNGLFRHEPNLLLLRAQAQFGLERYAESVATLEALIEHNPGFKSAEGHLLYARALQEEQLLERAIEEYRQVAHYYPGVEARYRLCLALRAAGREVECQEEVRAIQRDAKLAPAHFRKSQKHWLKAVDELA